MVQFVVKLKNEFKEKSFLVKLVKNFKTVNSSNMLLERDLMSFEEQNNIYVIITMNPIISNIPLYASFFALFLYGGFYLMFDKFIPSLLLGAGILGLMSLAWTKYFFYLLLRRSLKKYGVTYTRLL